MPWSSNVLMSTVIPGEYEYNMGAAPVFNSRIARSQIVSVTFLNSLENAGKNSWDISQDHSGSVLAWTKTDGKISVWNGEKYTDEDGYDLYIAADGGINGKYCSKLFAGYENVVSISFNGFFHTDNAKSMEEMFYGCYELEELDVLGLKTELVRNMQNMFRSCNVKQLDVSSFDTSNVEDMGGMFAGCSQLETLDLRNFDTQKVTNMDSMFSQCSNLRNLDISSFDTSNVKNVFSMFSYMNLESLDLRHFDTSKITNMAYMFSGSDMLISLDLRGFDTSHVIIMSGMFQHCKSLQLVQGIEAWDTSNVQNYDSFMDDGVLINGSPWITIFQ